MTSVALLAPSPKRGMETDMSRNEQSCCKYYGFDDIKEPPRRSSMWFNGRPGSV